MNYVKKTGDFDVLVEKWNDILTRDIDWKVRKCERFDKENDVKIHCIEGNQTLYFHKGRSEYKKDLYDREKIKSAYGCAIEIYYMPDSSKMVYFSWNYYLGYKAEVKYYQRDQLDGTLDEFGLGYIEMNLEPVKQGEADLSIYGDSLGRWGPRMAEFEPVVGSEFHGNLMEFCEKMEKLAEESWKAEKNKIDDEFDSI